MKTDHLAIVKFVALPWWPALIYESIDDSTNDGVKTNASEFTSPKKAIILLALDTTVYANDSEYKIEQFVIDSSFLSKEIIPKCYQTLHNKAMKEVHLILQSSSIQKHQGKRDDYISWDEYFMSLSFLSALRSKDPNTQVGACIVNEENKIVGIGYNGFPNGCGDDQLPWEREADNELDTKYMYVCHAETNAILNLNSGSAKNCTIYIFFIIIYIIIYDKYHDSNSSIASRKMFDLAGVKYSVYNGKRSTIELNLNI
ncbi:hypothetical protein WA158_006254 [Blastocystis sp. Blastoise]